MELVESQIMSHGNLSFPPSTEIFGNTSSSFVLGEGSQLNVLTDSELILHIPLVMEENSVILFEIHHLHQKMISLLSSKPSDIGSGDATIVSDVLLERDELNAPHLLIRSSHVLSQFLNVSWPSHIFEMEYKQDGVYLLFTSNYFSCFLIFSLLFFNTYLFVFFSGFDYKLKYIGYSSPFFIIMSVLLGGSLCVLIYFTLFTVKNWKHDLIRAATPPFLLLVLFGALLALVGSLSWIIYPNRVVCELRIWLPFLSYVLIIGPLLAKSWRIWRIFSQTNQKLRQFKISDFTLIQLVGVALIIEIILLLSWTIAFPNKKGYHEENEEEAVVVCKTSNRVSLALILVYNASLVVIGCYLSFRGRKVCFINYFSFFFSLSLSCLF